MVETVVQLVKNEDKQFRNRKEVLKFVFRMLLFILGISVFLYANKIEVNNRVLVRGMYLLAIFYLFTFYYSKMQFDKKVIILYVMPFTSGQILIFYKIVAFLKCFVQIIVPIYVSVCVETFIISHETVLKLVYGFCECIVLYVFASSMVLTVLVFLVYRRYIQFFLSILAMIAASWYYLTYALDMVGMLMCVVATVCSQLCFRKYNKYSRKMYAKKVSRNGLLCRELTRFVSDKVLLINHIGMCIFSLFFIINLIIMHNRMYFITTNMLLIPAMSTSTGCLYSLEADRIKLIKALPLNFNKIVITKYVVATIFTVPFYFLNLGLLLYFKQIDIWYCVSVIVTVLCVLVVKIIYDMKNSYTEFTNTKQLLEDSRKYKMWGMCYLFFLPVCFYPLLKVYVICPIVVIATYVFVRMGRNVNC